MRSDKLRVLQEALSGNVTGLKPLLHQRKKAAMRFKAVHGVIDIYQCPPLLMDIEVMPSESIINGVKNDYLSLKDCLLRFERIKQRIAEKVGYEYYCYSATGSIDMHDSRYDEVVLEYIDILWPSGTHTYLSHQPVKALREHFADSAGSMEWPFVLISFESRDVQLRRFATKQPQVA